jgi:dTDP-4-dehydrorhamnose 3,5-epimerase
MIDGVIITPLREIVDDRGSVRHVLRPPMPDCIGEVYFSTIRPYVVKAWHLHKQMTLRYAVAAGSILLGLFDARLNSPTYRETECIYLDGSGTNYNLVTIPPGIWNGFRTWPPDECYGAVLLNCPDLPHDPMEIERRDPRTFLPDFPWGRYILGG